MAEDNSREPKSAAKTGRWREGLGVDGIGGLIEGLKGTALVSETDVRTQLAVPLLDLLGYPDANRAEEFPIYGFEGRKSLQAKPADIVVFDS